MGNSSECSKPSENEDTDGSPQGGEGWSQHGQHHKFTIKDEKVGHNGTHDATWVPYKPISRVQERHAALLVLVSRVFTFTHLTSGNAAVLLQRDPHRGELREQQPLSTPLDSLLGLVNGAIHTLLGVYNCSK